MSRLFVDMDGVLADFMGGAEKVLGRSFNDDHWKYHAKGEHKIKVAAIHDFWEKLDWEPGGRELWNYVKDFHPNILSAYAEWDEADSKRGKYLWITKHLGHIPSSKIHLVVREHKQKYATTNGKPNILIDDYDKNIAEWKKAGGIGVHHVGVNSTIDKLKALGFTK